MRSRIKLLSLILTFMLIANLVSGCTKEQADNQNKDLDQEIDYGQEPPGLIPEVFAPGIISMPEDIEFGCTFTPDGNEIYYTVRKDKTEVPTIMKRKMEEGKWSSPIPLDVQQEGSSMEPHITMDGQMLYFGFTPLVEGESTEEAGIWQMKKMDSGWSEMSYLMSGMYVSTTEDGSIYLSDIFKSWELVKIPINEEGFGERIRLNGGPNTPNRGIHPCIARDESFIIFDSDRPGGFGGEGDLYVSFNLGGNQWSEGFNLGPTVNSSGVEFAASISPDGKYLFFMKDDDIYWVSIDIIESFRHE